MSASPAAGRGGDRSIAVGEPQRLGQIGFDTGFNSKASFQRAFQQDVQ